MITALGGTDDLGMRDCMVRYVGSIEPQILGTEEIEEKGFSNCEQSPLGRTLSGMRVENVSEN